MESEVQRGGITLSLAIKDRCLCPAAHTPVSSPVIYPPIFLLPFQISPIQHTPILMLFNFYSHPFFLTFQFFSHYSFPPTLQFYPHSNSPPFHVNVRPAPIYLLFEFFRSFLCTNAACKCLLTTICLEWKILEQTQTLDFSR